MAAPNRRLKASVKFRPEQQPLLHVKAPISILGLPLFTGCHVGEKEDLAVLLGTAMAAGPSVRLCYRPNDSSSPSLSPSLSPSSPLAPSTLIVKAGLGPWLSPNAFLSLSAEIDLKEKGNTKIMLKTNPKFGDFSLSRSPLVVEQAEGGSPVGGGVGEGVGEVRRKVEFISKLGGKPLNGVNGVNGINGVNGHVLDVGFPESNGKLENGFANGNGHIGHESPLTMSPPAGDMGELHVASGGGGGKEGEERGRGKKGPLAGFPWMNGTGTGNAPWSRKAKEGIWAMRVHSDLPLGLWGMATCRWGLTVPKDFFSEGGVNWKNVVGGNSLPSLALDKVTVYAGRGAGVKRRERGERVWKGEGGARKDLARLSDDVIALHAENYNLRKTMEDLKVEFGKAGKGGKGVLVMGKAEKGEMYGREENLLRSQAFDELVQDKANGREKKAGVKETFFIKVEEKTKGESKKGEGKKGESKKGENKKGESKAEGKKGGVVGEMKEVKEVGKEKGMVGGDLSMSGGKNVSKELHKAIMSANVSN